MIICPVHGQQSIVFVYEKNIDDFIPPLRKVTSSDWLKVITFLDGILEWHILIKKQHFKSLNRNFIESDSLIDHSKPICKKCVEEAMGKPWEELLLTTHKIVV